ncbi:peptidyl-prolyl cis-trans isomerase [Cystoisospora suis]|uniref:Peptidyl-prolyl cis-trans isomerase n=1 Tax=Cystoisospora suis TaxID=483139 RepID=A0A2C6KMR6_9APIC|nr:peptidyl-prolyl cis-trans isomerase [Cystoisospora suis]
MSEVYVHEPSTRGKVVLHTSIGELDIELWSKECPKACRNFVQLCLEGYYDNTIFHRVVKDFIVQGGDPTGTGRGGADTTFDGQPFDIEVHPRLKFRYRGLVGVANLGKGGGGGASAASKGSGTNGNQFFITLGRSDVLNNAYTLFGKITGHTLYNLMKFNDLEVGKEDRPEHPPVIRKTEVLWNPFDDIVPRKLPKREQGSREGSVDERKRKKASTSEIGGSKKRHLGKEGQDANDDDEGEQHEGGRVKLAKKDGKLLSFAEEEEEQEQQLNLQGEKDTEERSKKKKALSAHDVLDDPQLLKTKGGEEAEDEYEEGERKYYEKKENKGSLSGVKSRLAHLSSSHSGPPRPDHTSSDESDDASTERGRKTSRRSRERATRRSSEASSPDVSRSNSSSSDEERKRKTQKEEKTTRKTSLYDTHGGSGKREERVEALRFKTVAGGDRDGRKNGNRDGVANNDLMTETEIRRQKFLVRSKDVGRKQRQDTTLKKLDAFTEQLRRLREKSCSVSKKEVKTECTNRKSSNKGEKEAGTLNAILPDLDEEVEENDGSWLQNGGLRFAVDSARAYELDEARAAASVVVYDPLKGLSADAKRKMAEERKKQQGRGWKEGVRDVPKW